MIKDWLKAAEDKLQSISKRRRNLPTKDTL